MVSQKTAALRNQSGELDRAIRACRSAAWVMFAFSLAINVLMLASPLYMLQVYDRVLVTGRVETLIMLTLLIAGALLVLGLLDALRAMMMVRFGCWLNARLGPVLLASGVRARLVGDTAGGQMLRDLAQVQGFVSSQGLIMFFDAPWTPVFLLLIWFLHPLMGMVAVSAAVLLLGLSLLNEWLTRKATLNAALAGMAAQGSADATIRNAEVVRAMAMLPALSARWEESNNAALAATQRAAERGALILGLTKFLRLFVQSAILGLGAWLVIRGNVSGGVMIASSILLGRALGPVEAAMSTWRNLMGARIAFRRLKTRLGAIPAEPERFLLPSPTGRITMNRVSFIPQGARAPVLDGVSLTIRPGEVTAVIGPSAGGKSTLCRVLLGLNAPGSGQIRLDGSELHHWDPLQLGRAFGYLPQDVELFSGTISENIARMGRIDDEAVLKAAQLAHAHELIQSLPHGYNTQIGEGGARLSGGQRQRIGLARALYGTPCLVVLDEPNANLDQAGEAALSAAIRDMRSAGSAMVIVGHRPSTLACADHLVFLRDGRIEMQGPRDEILARLRIGSAAAGGMASVPRATEATAEGGTVVNRSAAQGSERELQS
ncbi:type I secretion system permease/ATPase [Rhodobacter sp. 24-YEA-8]|uniref:type I secretion system permease/ATPase n=1 Tax=Rhodobacter sp. 24-YEA-8 TaxID=1884310 RepID=UPI00089910FA|nr:type I secretion system permease/ATPase [Rhodobacter sp. 24-YEA-8]SED49034.1 ATP-binding cassette, subfamily C/ATP-binding cassette, subfamily C, EexD [Rhodobacter sp. 24-YEA-8]